MGVIFVIILLSPKVIWVLFLQGENLRVESNIGKYTKITPMRKFPHLQ